MRKSSALRAAPTTAETMDILPTAVDSRPMIDLIPPELPVRSVMRAVRVGRVLAASLFFLFCTAGIAEAGSAVVTNGRFTNVYVFPNSDTQTWEQHLAGLRSDSATFSRKAIDAFTKTVMSQPWPTYWDPLFQYNGIQPPLFFGSFVASKSCVDAALKDRHNGLVEWDTVRSLSNCHINGRDPSPQVNLIFSPDVKLAGIPSTGVGTGSELCTSTNSTNAYHAWGLNTPNFAAIPMNCMDSFRTFTEALTHEDIEILSDPGGAGMGDFGVHELGDNCENTDRSTNLAVGATTFSLARYWSTFDKNCQPRLDPPAGSVSQTWVLGQGSPLLRFTGSTHVLNLGLPATRTVSAARLIQALLVIQTGGDDLRGGGSPGDNANAVLTFLGGATTTANINRGRNWANGTTHSVVLSLPASAPRVSDITGVQITTGFGGGIGGDNWNVDKVALLVSFAQGSTTTGSTPPVVHTWLNASGGPLVRFTGNVHDHLENVAPQDVGRPVRALTLIISTGNDDLRGGGNPGDNCDVTVTLAGRPAIVLRNVNGGQHWNNWEIHNVNIPVPAGLKGGDVRSVNLHTGFGGGIGGDNWNVQQLQLQATL